MGLVIHSAREIVIEKLKKENAERPSIIFQVTGNLIEKSIYD